MVNYYLRLIFGSVYAATESHDTNYFALALSKRVYARSLRKTRIKSHIGLAYRKLFDNPWQENGNSLNGFSLTLNLQFQ